MMIDTLRRERLVDELVEAYVACHDYSSSRFDRGNSWPVCSQICDEPSPDAKSHAWNWTGSKSTSRHEQSAATVSWFNSHQSTHSADARPDRGCTGTRRQQYGSRPTRSSRVLLFLRAAVSVLGDKHDRLDAHAGDTGGVSARLDGVGQGDNRPPPRRKPVTCGLGRVGQREAARRCPIVSYGRSWRCEYAASRTAASLSSAPPSVPPTVASAPATNASRT